MGGRRLGRPRPAEHQRDRCSTGKLVERAQLPRKATAAVWARTGPQLEVVVESGGAAEVGEATIAKGSKTVSFYAERYLDGSVGEKVGERTEMIRRAFRKVMGQRRRRYFAVIGLVTLLFLGAGAFSVWQNKQLPASGRPRRRSSTA